MSFTVRLTDDAVDDLRRLDSNVTRRAVEKLRWLGNNFEAIQPEALSASLSGLFKLRGSYRAVYSIDREQRELVVRAVRHRSEIYKL